MPRFAACDSPHGTYKPAVQTVMKHYDGALDAQIAATPSYHVCIVSPCALSQCVRLKHSKSYLTLVQAPLKHRGQTRHYHLQAARLGCSTNHDWRSATSSTKTTAYHSQKLQVSAPLRNTIRIFRHIPPHIYAWTWVAAGKVSSFCDFGGERPCHSVALGKLVEPLANSPHGQQFNMLEGVAFATECRQNLVRMVFVTFSSMLSFQKRHVAPKQLQ